MKLRRRRGLDGGLDRLARAGEFLRSRRGRWVQTGIVVLLCFGIGYFLAAAWLFPAPERASPEELVRVPDLVGQRLADAGAQAADRGLVAAVGAELSHPRAEAGVVVAQSPLARQMAAPGDTVRLALSLGPRAARVPAVGGLSEAQATAVLERLGFTVRSRAVRAPSPGVQGSEPEAGALVALPAEVELRVGEGARAVAVPDLRGMHIDDVEGLLAEAGLQIGSVRYDPDAAQAPGRVVGQAPPAGYSLRGGGFVSLEVAGRPEGG